MKILVVNNNALFEKNGELYLYKETGKFFLDLFNAGHDVMVFQFKIKSGNNDFLSDYNISRTGVEIISVKRSRIKIWAYVKASILGYISVTKSDFVYLFYPSTIGKIIAIFCLLRRKNFGLYIRGERGIFNKTNMHIYRKARIIFTISPKFTEIILGIGGNVSTIRPMMDFSESDIVYDRIYKNKPFYEILYVGRLERAKGLYDVVEAFRMLIVSGITNIKLNIVGDGTDTKSLKEIVINYGINDNVIFYGTITDKARLSFIYRSVDLFIMATHHEGFPRVLYEAMIFGVPIITTFVGTIPYLMRDGYNCYKIDPKDVSGMADRINDVFSDYETKSIVASNGTKTITEYLSDKKKTHSEQMLEILSMQK